MVDTKSTRKTTTPKSSLLLTEKVPTSVSAAETRQPWSGRLWNTVKRYPIPLGAGALLVISLAFSLAARGHLANWTLLVEVLL